MTVVAATICCHCCRVAHKLVPDPFHRVGNDQTSGADTTQRRTGRPNVRRCGVALRTYTNAGILADSIMHERIGCNLRMRVTLLSLARLCTASSPFPARALAASRADWRASLARPTASGRASLFHHIARCQPRLTASAQQPYKMGNTGSADAGAGSVMAASTAAAAGGQNNADGKAGARGSRDLFQLPHSVVCYKKTPEWTQDTMPAGFKKAHSTAAGVWARVNIVGGSCDFVFEAGGGSGSDEEIRLHLTAGETLIVPPRVKHHVEPDAGGLLFFLEFHKEPQSDAGATESAAGAVAAGQPVQVEAPAASANVDAEHEDK